ncbi:plus-3-domain-containing protein [Basidiobolus meristosporus CBS 931.73]|uniref:Plus-3-domain-containing protein n=1 Tax=Basidiobolus meristosporus CBS 931.73 TaxID=1314790 RepID=A0A1Y1YY24_9FUNG|nr:plus-3-domain-containing protein [Basidiobolus meristosporus CBS 931.73]|eukprot:ORY02879.1 plus-3-domain-containing protein [Basidiobolus meristosporus CBS 931.73]
MDDLSDEILALVESGDEGNSRNTRKRRRRARDSDEEKGKAFSDDQYSDLEEAVDEYGPDLYKDSEDRRRLSAMTEMEREGILTERAEKRQYLLERLEVKKKLKAGQRRDDPTRRSSRATARESEKTKGLSELRRRREEKSTRPKRSSSPRRSKRRSPSYSGRSESEEDSDHDVHQKEKRYAKLEDLNSVRVGRDILEKWLHTPFFERTIIGCFVRIGLGVDENKNLVYRICQIEDVTKYHRPYRLGNTMTDRALLLKHGKAEKVFLMDIVSNGSFTMHEFKRLEATLHAEHLKMPTLDHVEEKKEDLEKAHSYVLSDAEINEMIQKKMQFAKAPLNTAMEKAQLIRLRETAEQSGDMEELQRLNAKLAELDELSNVRKKTHDNRLDALAELNKRNRMINMREGAKAEHRINQDRRSRIQDPKNPTTPLPSRVATLRSKPIDEPPSPGSANFKLPEIPDDEITVDRPWSKYELLISSIPINVECNL